MTVVASKWKSENISEKYLTRWHFSQPADRVWTFIILDRGQSPERHFSPRTKIMPKIAATRKLCRIEKS